MEKNRILINVISSITIVLVLLVGFIIYKNNSNIITEQSLNSKQYFDDPDRIVYKKKNEDKYYVCSSGKQAYMNIKNMLVTCIDSISEGKIVSQDEIKKIEDEENYIELDYNTISKNYIITYERDNYNVIKRTDNGGVIIKNNIIRKKQIEELIEEESKSMTYYTMDINKEYKVKQPIDRFNPSLFPEIKQYENGIYGIKIQDIETLGKIMNQYNIKIDDKIEDDIFTSADIIIMFSKYEIENISTRIGGITYKFSGKTKEKFEADLFVASKAINTNCIYRDISDIEVTSDATVKPTERTEIEHQTLNGNNDNELKRYLFEQKEINAQLIDLKVNGKNTATLICKVYWWDENYKTYKGPYNVDITVDGNTQIFSRKDNQIEELKKMLDRQDNLFVTLRDKNKANGRLIADNIEVMGC